MKTYIKCAFIMDRDENIVFRSIFLPVWTDPCSVPKFLRMYFAFARTSSYTNLASFSHYCSYFVSPSAQRFKIKHLLHSDKFSQYSTHNGSKAHSTISFHYCVVVMQEIFNIALFVHVPYLSWTLAKHLANGVALLRL